MYSVDIDSYDVGVGHFSTILVSLYKTWHLWVGHPEPECRSHLHPHTCNHNQIIDMLWLFLQFRCIFAHFFPGCSSGCSCGIWAVHKVNIPGLFWILCSGLHCHTIVWYPALDNADLALLLLYKIITTTKNHPATTVFYNIINAVI